MRHWLPVTQGYDQYRVSRAAEQAATANVLHWPCNVVIRAGVSTVADAVELWVFWTVKVDKTNPELHEPVKTFFFFLNYFSDILYLTIGRLIKNI